MKIENARVSSSTQDHTAQVEALKAAGCERIFSEKVSDKSVAFPGRIHQSNEDHRPKRRASRCETGSPGPVEPQPAEHSA